jgi:hypothetical protein
MQAYENPKYEAPAYAQPLRRGRRNLLCFQKSKIALFCHSGESRNPGNEVVLDPGDPVPAKPGSRGDDFGALYETVKGGKREENAIILSCSSPFVLS